MNRASIPSDRLVTRSDEPSGFIPVRPTQTTSRIGARLAAGRVHFTRHADRDLQALRAAELPLCQRTGTRPQALSVYQPTWTASTKRLRAQWRGSSGRPANRRRPQAAQFARRYLCNQRGIAETSRGARVAHHGSGTRCFRYCQGRCHSCRYGHCVPRCWYLAARSGGATR